MEKKEFCQSCAMPMEMGTPGTEADGSPNPNYCSYCYKNGAFTGEMTMDQMIDFCAPMTAKASGISTEEAKAQMQQYFPQLLRWKQ